MGLPDKAFEWILKAEGGYVNDPVDPGGETNMGITWKVYNLYRDAHKLPRQSVKLITKQEARAIYEADYWNPVAEGLAEPLATCVFDCAVNQGVNVARQLLAISNNPTTFLLIRQGIYTWMTRNPASPLYKFRKGWLARLDRLRSFLQLS